MKLEILNNDFLKKGYYLLELKTPSGFKPALPGQFLHIRIEDACDPLLRRPLSIHDVVSSKRKKPSSLKILYEVVGKGTRLLSFKKPNSDIDVLGPLGKGFDLKRLKESQTVYIVAGGMGVAPLFFLLKKIKEIQNPKSKIQIIVLLGAKTKDSILCEREFKASGCEIKIATEDGSKGFKGRVTDLLKKILRRTKDERRGTLIYACGPKSMLAAISVLAGTFGVPAQVSLEEFMGCGLGACLGCVVRTIYGYKRICHDGPVFNAEEIIWKD